MTKKFFPIETIPNGVRIRSNLYPSILFPPNAKIQAGDLALECISTNDRKDTVTFKLAGVFLEPKEDEGGESKILVPDKTIIRP